MMPELSDRGNIPQCGKMSRELSHCGTCPPRRVRRSAGSVGCGAAGRQRGGAVDPGYRLKAAISRRLWSASFSSTLCTWPLTV